LQVNAASSQLARSLAAAGVQGDVPVGLYLERGFPLVVAMIAVLKAGGCYVPLDPSYPADRLKLYVEVRL
jgi:non-ribosomal peptide synthetase component F